MTYERTYMMTIFEFTDERHDECCGAELPTKAYAGDAAWDLRLCTPYSSEPLAPMERRLFGTGVRLIEGSIDGNVGLICPRSGLATKSGVTVLNAPGVLDSGFRGEICVNLINLSDKSVVLMKGDRIAQLVVVPSVGWTDEGAVRGEGGHGSSGR